MEKFHKNNQNNNINNGDTNKVINTYADGGLKRIVTVKVYKWCEKCLKDLPEGSSSAFCCWECQQEYYTEIRKEEIACYNEWVSRS